jgi:ADP-ribose pyrophosphatase YjhB (NUDIX family)
LWTLPAGFLEHGESVAAGALRETLEEANARVHLGELYSLISLAQIGQVYMMFRGRLADLDFGPGPESLEVRLFREEDVPWEDLAFRTISRTLRNFFLDRRHGSFPLRLSTLERKPAPGGQRAPATRPSAEAAEAASPPPASTPRDDAEGAA